MKRALTLNLGSSSLKLSVLDSAEEPYLSPPKPLWSKSLALNPSDSLEEIMNAISKDLPPNIETLVHRVVHGGSKLQQKVEITSEVKQEIGRLSAFAPLHNPRALALIDAAEKYFEQKQFAAFDTAFFSTMPEEAYTYALPKSVRDQGIRRYGFHGLSHSYVTKRISALLGAIPKKIISLHLGSGCSIAAIVDGRAIYSTMGFTPLEGLVMGTRSGSIDPGIVLHLSKEMSVDQIENLLVNESGILGLSEQTSDMKKLLELVDFGEGRARLAYNVFLNSLVKHLGACFALLGGVDALIFTGGIGEHSQRVRDDLKALCKIVPEKIVMESEIVKSADAPLAFVIEAREEIEMVY